MSLERTFAGWRRQVLELAAKVVGRRLEAGDETELEEEWGDAFANGDSPKTFISEFYVLAPKYVAHLARVGDRVRRRRAAGPAPASSSSSSSLPRGVCASCGNDVAVRTNGTAREHRGRAVNGKWPRVCAGSGKRAKHVDRYRPSPATSPSSARSSAGLHKKTSPATSSRASKVATEIPASATLRTQFVKCGKGEACGDCTKGNGHGPYWYAAWKENGRTRSKYLGRELPAELLERRQQAEKQPADWSRPTRVRVRNELPIDRSQLKPGISPPPHVAKRIARRKAKLRSRA